MVSVIGLVAGFLLALIGYGHLRRPQQMVAFWRFEDEPVELSANEISWWKRIGIGLAVVGVCMMAVSVTF